MADNYRQKKQNRQPTNPLQQRADQPQKQSFKNGLKHGLERFQSASSTTNELHRSMLKIAQYG